MTPHPSLESYEPGPRFGRFDQAVILTMVSAILLTALLIWRGDRVGVVVEQLTPTAGAEQVSTQAVMRITFAQDMLANRAAQITLDPPVEGTARWEGRTLVFEPATALQPETTYTVEVEAGLSSQQGRLLLEPVRWTFHTSRPRVVYLRYADDESIQLAVVAPGEAPQQLTNAPFDVLNYAVSPDGLSIAYTLLRADGGGDVWLIGTDGQNNRQLLDCGGSTCSNPVWHPDGRRLVYERRNVLALGAPPGPPRLWWLDVVGGETVAVFEDSQWLGLLASFSPDGQWLSYVSPLAQEVQAYNLETGQTFLIQSRTGESAAWSRDSVYLFFTEAEVLPDTFSVVIYRATLATSEVVKLSGEIPYTDGWPSPSPDGQWLAFNRKAPNEASGKQIWLMQPDGSQARPLTSEVTIHHGPPLWSPDGQSLLYQQYLLAAAAEPAIWLLNVQTGEKQEVVSQGVQPTWLP